MAFNLKKVLKALLLSSNQPLAIKDIQAAFTRFHDRAMEFEVEENDEVLPAPAPASATATAETAAVAEVTSEAAPVGQVSDLNSNTEQAPTENASAQRPDPTPATGAAPAPAAEEIAEVPLEGPQDPELYGDVPSLVTATQIREAMDLIAAELRAADEGMLLIEGNAGYRLVTHPRFARWVRILRQEPPPVKLSQSSIETLAVVAYRQPVTRGEIETIRGVSAEAGITKLLERELVYVVGRADAPGRPIQYGTTDQFLEFVGIKSLDELPASDVLSSRQIDEWLKTSTTGHKPTDTDMGLADEQLPLEAPVPAPGAASEAAEPPPVAESVAPAPESAAPSETPPPAQA